MSDTSFRAYRTGSTHAAQRKADKIDQPNRPKRGSGIFEAINENLKARDQISYATKEKAKQAKNLAEQFKAGSTKISDDATVVEGYRDPGYSITQEGSAGFGGLIGTVGGAIAGSFIPGVGPMMGSQIGGKVGSYF